MRKPNFILVLFAFFALVLAAPQAFADEVGDLKIEIEGLKKGQTKMQKDLAEIKKLLKQRPAAGPRRTAPVFKPQDLSVDGSPFMGNADAPVTIVEFTDYHCPFCKRHSTRTIPQIVKDYVDTGKVRYVLREFPIKSIHPKAYKVAQAALCAGDQGKYWEMHDSLFKGAKGNPDDLSTHVEAVGLDAAALKECIDSGKFAKAVDKDIADGSKLGVRGTPSFFLGKTDPNDATKIKATDMLRGAQPFPQFKSTIEKLLNMKKSANNEKKEEKKDS